MSFDLKITDGDFAFGTDGNPVTVTDTDKLKQDIAKILLTKVGRDPGSPQYGCNLRDVLGERFDLSVLQGLISKNVSEAMKFLQSLQLVQGTVQDLSFQEVIGSIDSVAVTSPSFGKIVVNLSVTTVGGLREIYAIHLSE